MGKREEAGTAPTLAAPEAANPLALSHTLTQEHAASSGAAAQAGGGTGRGGAPSLAITGSGRFERGRELGRGGMGRVVEAIDRQFNRVVAIKELHGEPGGERSRRFATEALITGNLEHPGIPSVYERGVDERGVPFYAMRKVRGQTLGALLADARTLPERLALLPVVVRTAQTLGYAQEHGVIHRDVKPDNVIVGSYGDVVLLDWGIARVRGLAVDDLITTTETAAGAASTGTANSTTYGSVVGTPAYMAPEQAAGHTDQIDERTDVFALGAMLYHVLTGSAPYHGNNVDAVLAQARDGRARDVAALEPQAPAALAAICARAMAKQPSDRYRNATEMAAALEQFESAAFLARPPSRLITAVVNVVIAFAVLIAIVGSVVLVTSLPAFYHLGMGAYFVVVLGAVGAMLSALEWITRGRHHLSSLALGFALATFCGGFANVATGLSAVFEGLGDIADQPEQYRAMLAMGAWESIGGLTLGVVLASAQFLLWGIAHRRTRRAATEGDATTVRLAARPKTRG